MQAEFTVSLASPAGEGTTVDYQTEDETAAGTDYEPASGTLTFPVGGTKMTIEVTVNGDTMEEGDETFLVRLSNPVNGTIMDETGTGTIRDDDEAPTLSINNPVAAGDAEAITFTVSLTRESVSDVGVDYAANSATAKAGRDFLPDHHSKTAKFNL